jgi:hypothetical protein
MFNQLQDKALTLMKTAGYPILDEVMFVVDDELPIMGYTTDRFGKTEIVVSGWSLKTGMALGLVIHELSHVYRTQTFHPSHNFALQNKVIQRIFREKTLPPTLESSIHNVINNIQDLYADDIAFEVYIKKTLQNNLNRFFLGWVRSPTGNLRNDAENLISAAFAKANLERHEVKDNGKIIDKAVGRFLSQINKKQAEKFDFFKNIMVNLPGEVSDDDFDRLLTSYVAEFKKVATLLN